MNWKSYFLDVFKPNEGEIHGLNGIRAIAYFMLMYAHIYRPYIKIGFLDDSVYLRNFFINGSLCMEAFFTLSGFLIGGQLFQELVSKGSINYKNFLIKRVFRIFPPYYFFLIVQYFILVSLLKFNLDEQTINDLKEFISKIKWDFLYLTDYIQGTLMHGWSLSVEEKFYVILPILILIFNKIQNQKIQLVLIISLSFIPVFIRFLIFAYFYDYQINTEIYLKNFYYPFHSRLDSLLLGVFLAGINNFYPNIMKSIITSKIYKNLILISIMLLILIMIFTNEYEFNIFTVVFRYWVAAFCWSVIIINCLDNNSILNKILSIKFFSPIAKLSYCAYIIHLFLLGFLTKIFIGYRQIYHYEILIWFIPIGFMILGFAYFYYLVAEKPFLVLRKKLLR